MSISLLTVAALSLAAPPPKFELKDGDRIVWIGNTLVEREQRYGYWETALLAAFPDKNITVRNLGWSGDTVYGDARAGFDTPAKGFERLVSLTLELKPTVIFVSYGTNESFEGEKGLEKFEKGLNKLLDALKPSGARVVVFTPLPVEHWVVAAKLDERYKDLKSYSEAIRRIGERRNVFVVDSYENHRTFHNAAYDSERPQQTDNGIHLSETGYKQTAGLTMLELGVDPKQFNLDWAKLELLRQAVIAKNRLFFYKWRPQNETYLFGFRKHEQGKNAKEIAEFDPLIEAAEKDIRKALNELNSKK